MRQSDDGDRLGSARARLAVRGQCRKVHLAAFELRLGRRLFRHCSIPAPGAITAAA
jgi:hypothetical protein